MNKSTLVVVLEEGVAQCGDYSRRWTSLRPAQPQTDHKHGFEDSCTIVSFDVFMSFRLSFVAPALVSRRLAFYSAQSVQSERFLVVNNEESKFTADRDRSYAHSVPLPASAIRR